MRTLNAGYNYTADISSIHKKGHNCCHWLLFQTTPLFYIGVHDNLRIINNLSRTAQNEMDVAPPGLQAGVCNYLQVAKLAGGQICN